MEFITALNVRTQEIYTLSKKSNDSGFIPKITNGIKSGVNGIKKIKIRIN